MNYKPKIQKALVVLSPDLIRPDAPKQSPLLQRAITLAKITGCELELFHVCYDGEIARPLFVSDDELERKRKELTDRDATLLQEIVARLKSEGINVRHEVRWDSPRTDAILRKTAQAKPDIVMKQAREHSYVLGITTNTDWELARRSPASVWFVNDEVEDIGRVMAAVGNSFSDQGDITTAADYDLLRVAGLISDAFDAEVYPVNAFQAPEPENLVAGVAGTVMQVASSHDQNNVPRDQRIRQHRGSVKALAQYFNIPKDNVHIREGQPNAVIPDVAESVGIDMIVMGASDISRFERVVSPVTVEPVMAETNTDMLIVRERDLSRVPDATKSPVYGVPKYDLEHAITRPAATFDSPLAVANLAEISVELRRRILQAWECDIRAEMADENEGGRAREIEVDVLDEIFSARALLEMKQQLHGNGRMELRGMHG